MGVTALRGMTVVGGKGHRRLHRSANTAPVSMVTGRSTRWLDVPSRRKAT